jgi:predicted ATPase
MEGKRLLQKLRLTNFLSYGPEGEEVELQPLNVLIGPNGSGKSNLIQAISLLKAAPADIAVPIRQGGVMPEWPWKGGGASPAIDFEIEATASYPAGPVPLRYRLHLVRVGQSIEIADEVIENEETVTSDEDEVVFFYRYQHGESTLNVREQSGAPEGRNVGRRERHLIHGDLNPTKSVLAQRKDPDTYPELTYLGELLSQVCLFRDCSLGTRSPLRGPQAADLPSSFLLEDGSNLGMVINDLQSNRPAWKSLMTRLNRFCEWVEDITTRIQAGTVEVLLHERELGAPIPSASLSDGMLRYLSLLVILCHPSPSPLVCIEDPEVGLHPDVLHVIAELLVEASHKTQLVVTTHSDVLVSAFSDLPEAVIVCEKDYYGTHLRRLERELLEDWLRRYSLGELWRMGETGGNP